MTKKVYEKLRISIIAKWINAELLPDKSRANAAQRQSVKVKVR